MRNSTARLAAQLLIGPAVLLLMPALALGQTGKLSGEVVEAETGDPLPGANVRIEGTTKGAAANEDGEYTIFQVQPGTYTIVASFVGYQTVRRRNVEIVSGVTERLDFELQGAEFEGQEIVVTAQEDLVSETATNAVRRIDREELESLPTQSSETYYTIQPGVTEQNGEIHVRGARSSQTDYLLEGISTKSVLGSDNVVPVIPQAIEETQVFSGGYAADKGGANGGIVQQKLRTGGETISAMAQYEGDQIADVFGDTYSYDYQNVVATTGGPLARDDIRFFVAGNYRDSGNRTPLFWNSADLNEKTNGGLCADISSSDCHPPVDDNTQDTASTSLSWQDGNVPGLGNPEEEWRINGTLSFDFSPLQVRLSYASVNREQRLNFTPVEEFYNQRRIPKREDTRRLVSVQPTYFITENTFLEGEAGYFQYDFEVYDPLIGKPSKGKGGVLPYLLDMRDRNVVAEQLGVGTDSASLAQSRYTRLWAGRYQTPPGYTFNAFGFEMPGEPSFSGWRQQEQSYWNFSIDLVSQQGAHTLRFGGEYRTWTVRNYSGGIGQVGGNLAAQARENPALRDTLGNEPDRFAQSVREADVNYYGYDEFGNEVDSGPDGPREPVLGAMYINDKLEYEDIIVNAGLRLNYYSSDSYVAPDPANPPIDESIAQIAVGGENGLKEADADINLEPRLGISFPISEKTAFHLQYGKFSQLPDLGNVYAGRGEMTDGGGFDPYTWDVDPIKTTQYEIGFGRQFSEFVAFDLTAYYRRTDDLLTIEEIQTSSESGLDPYFVYTNGAFNITRGVELSLRSRRFRGVMAMANYSLTNAKGTETDPRSRVGAINQRSPVPSQVKPLRYQRPHTGSVVLDYQSGSGQSRWASDWGVNLLFRFGSGHPYTKSTGGIGQRRVDQGPLLVDSDPRNRVPQEPLNSSTTPFTYLTDLRLKKGFNLGPASLEAYIYVQNLLNRRNTENVYLRTGRTESDGFLDNPELSREIVASEGQRFVDYYQQINLQNRSHYRESWGSDLFGEPRQVRVGVTLTY